MPGAAPPLVGWTAATGTLEIPGDLPGLILFAVLFLWQVPHFHSIAWLYRRDYRRGGFRMLASLRPQGVAMAAESIVATALLVASTHAMAPGAAWWWNWLAGGANLVFVWAVIAFCIRRAELPARLLLYVSLIYLPLILVGRVVASQFSELS